MIEILVGFGVLVLVSLLIPVFIFFCDRIGHLFWYLYDALTKQEHDMDKSSSYRIDGLIVSCITFIIVATSYLIGKHIIHGGG